MSAAATAEASPGVRQTLYLDTFADIDATLVELDGVIATLPASLHTEAMRNEVASGIATARSELEELAADVASTAPGDEPDGRVRVPSFFGEFEKVIDVVKPEIAGYGDPDLTSAFAALPACQFGVKDVDDGVARSND